MPQPPRSRSVLASAARRDREGGCGCAGCAGSVPGFLGCLAQGKVMNLMVKRGVVLGVPGTLVKLHIRVYIKKFQESTWHTRHKWLEPNTGADLRCVGFTKSPAQVRHSYKKTRLSPGSMVSLASVTLRMPAGNSWRSNLCRHQWPLYFPP